MSYPAQLAFLSKLDVTAHPPNTVFVFTANDTAKLEDRFQSRCRKLKFEKPEQAELVALLLAVWRQESHKPAPDLEEVAQAARGNIRDALMELELELIAPRRKPPELQPRIATVIKPPLKQPSQSGSNEWRKEQRAGANNDLSVITVGSKSAPRVQR